ncbi:MAG: hypothetical protein L0Y56_08855 [Nitrospira sp.]|nr:hypothetical protein [Nitrospira sp.]
MAERVGVEVSSEDKVGETVISEGVLADVAAGVGAVGNGRSDTSSKMSFQIVQIEKPIIKRMNRKKISDPMKRILVIINLFFLQT